MRPSRSRVHRTERSVRLAVVFRAVVLSAFTAAPASVAAQHLVAEPNAPTSAARQVDQECCLVLLIPVGARSTALGGTLTSRSSADVLFLNPAGLAAIEDDMFFVHHSEDFSGQADAFTLLVTPGRLGTIGGTYQIFNHGEIETTDRNGQRTGLLTLRDHLFVASFAAALGRELALGLNYKLFLSQIDCSGACGGQEVSARTHGMDAGVRFQPGWLTPLQLGAAITNLGFDLQVVNAQQSDPLPTRVRIGAAYDVMRHIRPETDDLELWLALDLSDEWQDLGTPVAAAGAELAVQEIFFLRAGYVPGTGLGTGAALGIGLYYDPFTVAVARSFVESALETETEPFQISFGVTF